MSLKIEKEEFVNKTFRLNKKQIDKMYKICSDKGISMNKLVAICIDYALGHLEDDEEKKKS